jgi:Cu2+-exporting ATPase
LLLEQGLGRYYDLAQGQVAPAVEAPGSRSHTWLQSLVTQAEAKGEVCSLQLDVQGIHCAACVWLMNETFRRRPGAAEITVNPTLGQVRLVYQKGRLDVADWVTSIEAFGYQFGPSRKQASKKSIDLPLRLGIAAAITMNVMLFSISFYFGLSPSDPEVFKLFTQLSFVLSTVNVLLGGWPFFQAAVRGLRSRLLHLDLPIAVGIVLVYSMSVVQLRSGRGDLTFLDTLNTFITLMLLGRFLQERVLERNRRFLLDDDGAESILVRKVVRDRLETMPAPLIVENDLLLVAPGDLVPVEATLVENQATISTDWISGESRPQTVEKGAAVPAGSFNAGQSAFHVIARTPFADSPLVVLLRQPTARPGHVPKHHQLWNDLARSWVIKVLLVAAAGFLVWLPVSLDKAINVAASLLVITCPCAIGIAIPLAYELTQSRLRRMGFYVRSADLLDRLVRVKKVLFDKTGTLTLGRLELAAPGPVLALEPEARDVAYNLAVRSSHPVSACLARTLAPHATYAPTAAVQEHRGQGMEWKKDGHLWRLGRQDWATGQGTERESVLVCDGHVVVSVATREALRHDARQEVTQLQTAGYDVWLISGDAQARVDVMARTLGIPADHALAAQRPEDKAVAVERLDAQDTLYLGDGVNDALAFDQALCAGTPAIDRPVMPGRSDFFLVGEGLAPVNEALAQSVHLRAVVQRVLRVSLTYNIFAIGLSLLGQMTPLAAAISMPASTLSLILMTVWSLKRDAGATVAHRVSSAPPPLQEAHS